MSWITYDAINRSVYNTSVWNTKQGLYLLKLFRNIVCIVLYRSLDMPSISLRLLFYFQIDFDDVRCTAIKHIDWLN